MKPSSINNISVGDIVNWQGVNYGVASIGTISNPSNGVYSVPIVLSNSASTALTLKTFRTVLSSWVSNGLNSYQGTWVHI
jgi:hypothetical protein